MHQTRAADAMVDDAVACCRIDGYSSMLRPSQHELRLARHHVSEALARVEEQRGLISHLRTMDFDTTAAEALLCSLQECLSILRCHKERLEQESVVHGETAHGATVHPPRAMSADRSLQRSSGEGIKARSGGRPRCPGAAALWVVPPDQGVLRSPLSMRAGCSLDDGSEERMAADSGLENPPKGARSA
jgi:hypothetical protein